MNDLLAKIIDAHGGLDRWNGFGTATADMASGGELLDRKAPQSADIRHMTVSMHEQAASVTPFGSADKKSAFRPDRVAVETLAGGTLAERTSPRESFFGHDLGTPWDPLQRAYFNGYAMWSYLTVPFSFALPGVAVHEIDPLEEDGEIWRGLRVVMPAGYATHSRAQDFYFGPDYLLRRQDYTLDVADGCNVANYALDIVEVQGLRLPSKRRAYRCDKAYNVQRDRLLIWIDLENIAFR